MGAGRYNTNKRVNTATSAAAKQRAAALASGPAYPVVSDPVVNLPVKSVVQPAPEEFASLASPFDVDFSKLDFGGSGGYSGLDLDLSDLDIDALREAVNPTPAPVERVPTTASFSQGLQVQDFGAQPKFGSPDEALANYGNVFNTLKGQEEQVNKVYNYNQFDPGDFGRTSVSLREGNRAAGTGLAEYVQQNKIPLYKVIDGERKYLTTGNPQANAELWPNGFQGGTLIATGAEGTYSTTFVKDANFVDEMLATPILRAAAAVATGGASEAVIAAGKGLAGETLHASDWLSLAMAGANAYADVGVTQAAAEAAATSAVDAAYAAGTVQNAYEMQALYDATLAATKIQGVIGGVDVSGLLSTTSNLDPTDLQDVVNSANSFSTVYTNIKEDNEQSDVDAAIALADRLEQERLDRLEKDSTDALAATEVVVSNPVTGEAITPTGVTPDMPSTVTDVEPVYDVEPIVNVPPADSSDEGGGGGSGEGGDTGGDSGATPPVETTPPADVTGDAGDVNGGTVNGGGTYDGKILVDAGGNESRFDDRQGTWDEFLETGRAVLIDSTDEAVWGKSGTFTVTIDGETNEIDWTKGTYNEVDPSVPVETVPPVETPAPVETAPPVEEELLDEEAPVDFTTIGDLLDDTTVDPVTTPVDVVEVTDPATGTADTGTATGDGTGTGTGTGDTVGTGDTTGTGAGGGDATGTGDGTGSGDGSGDGDGDGRGDGRGAGSGVGAGNGSRTTDSLFGDMLQLETQIGSTQDLLKPFSLAPVPAVMNYNLPQVNPIQQFVQQQQETQLRNRPQGMLTNSEILKRYPF